MNPIASTSTGSRKYPLLQWNQFHWAALLLCTVIANRPVIIFLNSSHEFSLSLNDVARSFGVTFLKLFLALGVMGILLNASRLSKLGKMFTGTMLAVAVLLWIQGNFLLWDYGKLDGKPLNFGAYAVHGMLEAVLWVSLITFGVFKFEVVSQWAKRITLIVLASLFLSTALAYIDMRGEPWYKTYEVTYDNYYSYSNQKNIIVLVIDAARSDVFEKMLPELSEHEKSIFNGFTFFRNTTGTFNATNPAVTGILTGRLYDNKDRQDKAYPELFYSSTSLPYQLKKAGFGTEVYPYNNGSVFITPKIVDNLKTHQSVGFKDLLLQRGKEFEKLNLVAKFNFSPHFVKKVFFDSSSMYGTAAPTLAIPQSVPTPPVEKEQTGLPKRLIEHLDHNRAVIDNLGSQLSYRNEPVFKYLHFHGAHPPFIHDENYVGKVLPFTIDSYKKQFKGSLLMTTRALIDSLKRQGVYDKTMLIVIGDHGMFIPQSEDSLQSDKADRHIVDMLIPLLMVKPFGDSSGPIQTSSAPVSLFDIPATVFDALGMNTENVGRSVFSVRHDENRSRFAYPLEKKEKRGQGERNGAFEYIINGDAQNPLSWKPTYYFLRAGHGKVQIEPGEYQAKAKLLSDYLYGPERYNIDQWR